MSIIDQKLELLSVIEDFLDELVRGKYRPACAQGCAVCCTQDITATTLEAHRMLEHLKQTGQEELLGPVKELAAGDLFRPKITTNTLAMACMNRQEPPMEEPGPEPGLCPFLKNDECLVYEARPFSCRGMYSLVRCEAGGEAEIPPELITLITSLWQVIEHLDVGGLYGNFIDLLATFGDQDQHFKYTSGGQLIAKGLPPTRPIPGLLVPPGQVEIIKEMLGELYSRDCGGQTFRERMAGSRNSPF